MSKKKKKKKHETMDLREYKKVTANGRKIATYGDVDLYRVESGFIGVTKPDANNGDPIVVVKADTIGIATNTAADWDKEARVK